MQNVQQSNATFAVVIAVLAILLLLPLLWGGLMMGGMMGPGMMRWGEAGSPWWLLAWAAGWLIVAGGLILAVAWAVRLARSSARPDPLAILKERYARGELTREQYEQMRRDLQD
jgi:putative membrane protein